MPKVTIPEVLKDWNEQDLSNLQYLLESKKNNPTIQNIEELFKWRYHSLGKAKLEKTAKNFISRLASKVNGSSPALKTAEEIKGIPSYDLLLTKATKHVKANEKGSTLQDCELYLSHAVIIGALQSMSPSQRVVFFTESIDMDKIVESAHIKSTNFKGPILATAALGAAQASGFGVYMASTTALGFLTHAIGITLPFAVYTGLTSTIAFIIGPAGWLTVGVLGALKLTQPKWKRIIPALVFIISINSRKQLV